MGDPSNGGVEGPNKGYRQRQQQQSRLRCTNSLGRRFRPRMNRDALVAIVEEVFLQMHWSR